MKKTIFALLMAGALLATLTSCGGSAGSGNSLASEAITKAEAEVTLNDNTIIGAVPSLTLQMKAANTALAEVDKAERDKIMEGVTDESSYAKAEKKAEEWKAEYDAAKVAISANFKDKMGKAEASLIGKDVAVEFDRDLFSAANVTVAEFPDTTQVKFKADLTTVGKYKSPCVSWQYLDANGAQLSIGASYDLLDRSDTGFTVILLTNAESMANVAKIRFVKP